MKRCIVLLLGIVLVVAASGVMAFAGHGQINVNEATAEELQLLPGIGEATARNIIDYRTANGPFSSVDDLVKVKGIGGAKLGAVRDFIKLDGMSDYRLTEATPEKAQAPAGNTQ